MGVFLSRVTCMEKEIFCCLLWSHPHSPKPIHLFWVVIQNLIKKNLSDRKKTQNTRNWHLQLCSFTQVSPWNILRIIPSRTVQTNHWLDSLRGIISVTRSLNSSIWKIRSMITPPTEYMQFFHRKTSPIIICHKRLTCLHRLKVAEQ